MVIRRDEGLLKISEIAEKAGVLPSTIRHYTDLGLLKFAATTEGGHRLYHEMDTLAQLARIRRLALKGFALPDIKTEMEKMARTKKVLVVDDEQEVVDLVIDALKDKPGYEVKSAMNGFFAGRVLGDFAPDLVVLDLMLPGVDGFEVCRQIRADRNLLGTRIIAVTGYDTPENAKKIMEAGADMYLTKPIDVRQLLSAVAEMTK